MATEINLYEKPKPPELDLAGYTPAEPAELLAKIVKEFPDVALTLDDYDRKIFRDILEASYHSGRLVCDNEKKDACGIARMAESDMKLHVRACAENMTPVQQVSAYDITVMAYRMGYRNPEVEEMPYECLQIAALLDKSSSEKPKTKE